MSVRSHRLYVMRVDRRAEVRLLRAFARKDAGAAEELYRAYAPRIYGLGLVMLGTPEQAEDLVQDTFVRLWRRVDDFDPGRGSLDTWVLLMARSLAIDRLRRRVLETRTLAGREQRDVSDEAGPDEVAAARDMAERARRALAGLSPAQRAALELAYFGGKTSAEVAELEGIPLGTAKTRIRTALIRLRDALEAEREV